MDVTFIWWNIDLETREKIYLFARSNGYVNAGSYLKKVFSAKIIAYGKISIPNDKYVEFCLKWL
jgi:hypothetical protein